MVKVYNASQLHPTSKVVSEKEYRKLEERVQAQSEMLKEANREIYNYKRALKWAQEER